MPLSAAAQACGMKRSCPQRVCEFVMRREWHPASMPGARAYAEAMHARPAPSATRCARCRGGRACFSSNARRSAELRPSWRADALTFGAAVSCSESSRHEAFPVAGEFAVSGSSMRREWHPASMPGARAYAEAMHARGQRRLQHAARDVEEDARVSVRTLGAQRSYGRLGALTFGAAASCSESSWHEAFPVACEFVRRREQQPSKYGRCRACG
jgi:hypothetical protein